MINTDTWEQRKFGDIGSIAMCKRIFKEQTSDEGEVPFYKIGTFGVEPDAFISKELFDEYKTKYPYPNKGDILISASGSIGRTVEFTGKDEYFQDSNIVWLKHGNEIDNSFLKVLYSIVEWSCEGSTIKRLYNDNFLKTEFMLPQIDEQIKLGTYFSNLDNLITLHQRKLFLNFAKRNDWEQRKLGEVFQEYSEKNHPELPALTIIQGGGTVLREESERKLQYDKSSLAGYKMVREDDFIVHLRSFEGGLEKSNHNGLISPAYHTFHGDEVDSRFYYPYFRSYEFIKHKLVPHVYGIRDGRSIDIDSMKTIEIPWTSYEEQKKIGDYIESLDTLITLHQRKCDETKKLKKFMLQKMFPKKDAKKPEIRFAGFTDDWEQRKLVDVVDVRSGRDYKHLEEGDIPVYGTGGYMLSVNEALSDDEDAIGIGRKGTIDNPYILRAPFWTVDTLFYAVPRDKYDLNFVFDIFQNVNWKAKDESTGVPSLSKATINAVETLMPEYAEQKKIGEYFSYLDNFITLHQRKCDELKEFKKYMLQNMFPQKG